MSKDKGKFMKNLAKRNTIPHFRSILSLTCIVIISIFLFIIMEIAIMADMTNAPTDPSYTPPLIVRIILAIIAFIVLIKVSINLIKNIISVSKIIKKVNSCPEYLLEVDNDTLRINLMNTVYDIKLDDITQINYSYDRTPIFSKLLSLETRTSYSLNTNTQKENSIYPLLNLDYDYVPLTNLKKSKHGILFISTETQFFVLLEINNIDKCFYELKQLCSNLTKTPNTSNEDYIKTIHYKISTTKDAKDFTPEEASFINIVNMMERKPFSIDDSIKFLTENNIEKYLYIVLDYKQNMKNTPYSKPNKRQFLFNQFYRDLRSLNDEDPFYENYLIPFVQRNGLCQLN